MFAMFMHTDFFILEGGLIWELSYKIEDFYRLCRSAWGGGEGCSTIVLFYSIQLLIAKTSGHK